MIVGERGKPLVNEPAKIVTSQRVVPGVEQASAALRRADNFYAAGMKRFNDLTVEAMVKDATKSGFVEPEKVASRIATPGMNEKLLRIQKSVTPETFGQIGAERWKQMLDESRSPLTGEVSGRLLADRLKKMGPVLETLYGKAESGRMMTYAEHLAALNGDIPASVLKEAAGIVNPAERQAMRDRLQVLESQGGTAAEISALKEKLQARPLSQTTPVSLSQVVREAVLQKE